VIVSTHDLAALLGVTTRQIQLWAKEGIAVRVDQGKFDAAKSVQNRIAQAGRKAPMATAKTALDKEKTRLAKEQADAQRLKNQILRSEMLPRNAVEQEWADIMRTVRMGVLACTSRIRNRLPHLTAHDGQIIDRELREALTALADDAQAKSEGAANSAAAPAS
jgi:phage terminase Nu1 subunit (DNA packaging protein)